MFLSAVLGILAQAVLAATLGLTGAADAYLAALALCLLVTFILNQTVVNRWGPELAQLVDPMHAPTSAFWVAAWRLCVRVGAVGLGVGIALFIGAEWAVALVAPGLTDTSREMAVAAIRVMSLPLGVQLSASGLTTVLYALQRQPLIQAAGLLYSVCLIGSVLWLTPILGPISAAIGAAVSFCLMFLVVLAGTLSIARRPVSQFVPRTLTRKDHASVTIVTLASIVSYGQVLVAPVIASTLGQGAVAQLSFAFRPVEVLVRGLPSVISYSVMPGIAAARGRGDSGQVKSAVSEAMRLTLVLMLPIAALLAAVRTPLVAVLYQRAAFSADAVRAVAPTLGWYAAALPVFSLLVVLNVVLLTIGRERLALAMGVGVLAIYCVLGLTLGRIFGGSGVALGFCAANVLVGAIGVVARGRQALGAVVRSSWFRWILAGALFAFVIGDAVVELTRSLPVLVQLASGLVLGGAGAAIGVARAETHSVRTATAWLTSAVAAPLRQLFGGIGG